jgi:glutaconate CoA-transferase subunit B
MGVRTEGPALLVTDLCVMTPDPDTKEFRVVSIHPGVTRDQVIEATGWAVKFADGVTETPAPTAAELEALRDLNARTARAHGTSAGE